MKSKAIRYCSFCGKSQHEVVALVVGPGEVAICNECVVLVTERIVKMRPSLELIDTSSSP